MEVPFTERLNPLRLKMMSRVSKQFSPRTFTANFKQQYAEARPIRRYGTELLLAHSSKIQSAYRGSDNARHRFIGQLLTTGIQKEWKFARLVIAARERGSEPIE